ncbi:slipin family protein [Jannaschia aquimarina]|uniref:FtsH protease regulator HflK n=1 Tax=Jannaschia aquimarina TaxID=935700 RepID=A0A0D1D2Y1_9RHOB|nr:slipin family protein [Jannaschia aquimarina]KIT14463.1 FtsH protease regulator HflK [Jannaschia aquimarina]SNT29025.1 SPFH domain, Band 7 family protein [Jannaschia aquimarina]
MLERLMDLLTGTRRITLTEAQLGLKSRKGRLVDVLGPGEHRLDRKHETVELFDLNAPAVAQSTIAALSRADADLAETHLMRVEAGADEMIVILRAGQPYATVAPLASRVYWKAGGPWELERHAVGAAGLLPTGLGDRLVARDRTRSTALAAKALGLEAYDVADGHLGFLTEGGVVVAELAPGRHWVLPPATGVGSKLVDLRTRVHDVTGQEVLTRDRVTLRVNLTAGYRVTDARAAVSTVRDFEEALHRSLQLALRRIVGTRTLDQLLADKVAFDADAAEAVRTEARGFGVEVGAIELRDVILPGEMRDILTAVVAAEKEAEASVIRRREETNATRALLNTAKVMADNPVMLRLKELEALETVASRVERLTVHNGTGGLLGDIVRLRD